ncbi:hypothetical protein LguiB_014511 [Lonicera macranthoides]
MATPTPTSVSSSAASTGTTIDDEATKPLWAYTNKEDDKRNKGGGNMTWTCNICMRDFKSSYTRVRAHLLKILGQGIGVCQKVTQEDLVD